MAQLPLDARPEEMMQVAGRLQTLISEIEAEKTAMDTLVKEDFTGENAGTVSNALAGVYSDYISAKLADQITTLTTSKTVLEGSSTRLAEAESTTTSSFNRSV